jgi:flagellar basal-body rod modification protein FlgD
MGLDGVTGTVFREAAIPGLSDTAAPTSSTPAVSTPNKTFPNLTPAQSAANIKAAGGKQATDAQGNPLTGAAGGALGKTEFLQLLVQEMTNQDPLKPADNTQFIAQLAQFSTLEQMQNMNTGLSGLQSTFSEASARGLLGVPIKSVSSTTGVETDGVVDQILQTTTTGSDGAQTTTVQVDVNGTAVNLGDITAVGSGASTGATSGSGSSAPLPGTLVPPSSGSGSGQ